MTGTIVCGTDLGPSGARAADVAAMLAGALDLGVCLVHAATGTPELDPGTDPATRPAAEVLVARLGARHEEAARALAAEKDRLVAAGVRVPSARIVEGRPWEVVVREAESLVSQLVVVGPHARARAVRDRFLGSTADEVVRRATCPAVVATGSAPVEPLAGRELLVAVDGERPSLAALRCALQLAARVGARVHAVCVTSDPAVGDAALAATRAIEREVEDVPMRWSVRPGSPADVILDAAAEGSAALVCLGTHGRRGLPRAILGSVAEDVARRARVAVLVCRADDAP